MPLAILYDWDLFADFGGFLSTNNRKCSRNFLSSAGY